MSTMSSFWIVSAGWDGLSCPRSCSRTDSENDYDIDESSNWELDTSSSAAARSARSVMWNGCDILDPADPETSSCQHSNRGLRTWAGSSRSMSAWRSHSNVKSCDASVLRRSCSCTGRLHRSIW
jgi:hypothetical protein